MNKHFSLYVGWRNFSSGNESRLVSFISLLAIIGLILGVALLVVVLSVMNGFDHEMKTRILSSVPHLRLLSDNGFDDWQQKQERLANHPNVISISPFSEIQGMLSYRGKVTPIELRGLTPASDNPIRNFMPDGLLENLAGNELVVAKGIAKKMDLAVNSSITLLIPRASKNQARHQIPAVKVFTVKGFLETRTTLDQTLVIGSMQSVNQLAEWGASPQGLEVQVRDIFDVRNTGYQLLRMLPQGHSFSDWLQTHGNLYQAIKMSRSMVSLLVFLIIAIAVFNVVSMLVMVVVDKRSAIAILKTLGATNQEIILIFLTQGIMIGITGAFLGAGLGVLLSLNITDIAIGLEKLLDISFINSEIYPIDYLPSQLVWADVWLVVVMALCLNFLATLYPAWKAAQTRPAEVLRYE